MSYETYLIIMYSQLLIFLIVSFALIGSFIRHSVKKTTLEEAAQSVSQEIPQDQPTENGYLDVIYEQSHREDSKISNVRLHGKHK